MKKLTYSLLVAIGCLSFITGCSDGERILDEVEAQSHRGSRQIKTVDQKVLKSRIRKISKTEKDRRRKQKEESKKLSKKERKALIVKARQKRNELTMAAIEQPDESWSKQDKNIFTNLRAALRDESAAKALKAAAEARTSSEPEVRKQAVEALGWFGKSAMSGLAGYLSDPDEDIAAAAQQAFEQGLLEIEDDAIKLQYIETAMSMISDEEMLDSIAMNLNSVEDQGAAVETIVKIAGSDNATGVAKAKEAYEFITGDEWSGDASALKWASENHPSDIE